ncbi:LexA family transcriptional regulator [Gallaecimonas xiamenensis]|uniref:Transcriptional regulator,Cro/CI family protein n=1 Tax=Gallaecimonas xiamenensis 3-C-1 TaxID=745411 RepID=K2JY50_9GAMM|nr:helix-turn-helix transcriptional regulator [Gallaecimonas xiamenensis]EKE75219.1 transcriptional regulator,Cro/CI family protein [Gallaecimonas xiamenensis 3-C-1]
MNDEKKEQANGKGNGVPIVDSEKGTELFITRLRTLVNEAGGGRQFARNIGMSYSKLHNYMSGVSKPTLDSLIALAEGGGVSLDWLALGDENRHPKGQPKHDLEWVTAAEVAGLPGMPTTDKRVQEELEHLAADNTAMTRRRAGSRATEYHVALLPSQAREALKKAYEVKDTVASYEPSTDFMAEFSLIPGYRVQVSAGHGSFNGDDQPPVRHLAFRRKWLSFRGFAEKDLVIVWAKGDSMYPTIGNNDSLVINTARKTPKDGHIYVFRQDESLMVKRFQQRLDKWVLLSDNKVYPEIVVPKDEQHNFQVIGQVVHIAKDVGD